MITAALTCTPGVQVLEPALHRRVIVGDQGIDAFGDHRAGGCTTAAVPSVGYPGRDAGNPGAADPRATPNRFHSGGQPLLTSDALRR